jgi:hypothetical protein
MKVARAEARKTELPSACEILGRLRVRVLLRQRLAALPIK